MAREDDSPRGTCLVAGLFVAIFAAVAPGYLAMFKPDWLNSGLIEESHPRSGQGPRCPADGRREYPEAIAG